MPKPIDGELNDVAVHLLHKGLYVEPLCYPMDMEKFPANGHEYIHRVRLEESSIFPEAHKEAFDDFSMFITSESVLPETEPEKINLGEWKRKISNYFSRLANEVRSKKKHLLKKFPQRRFPLITNEEECCLFCLGSELYQSIYKTSTENFEGHFPYLSIILYLSQNDIEALLGYMNKWFNAIGMKHDIARWVFCLLACLLKPVSEDCETFLETFCDDIIAKSKVCGESEKNQLHLISAILKNYFCIKAYKVGPSLDQFLRLC